MPCSGFRKLRPSSSLPWQFAHALELPGKMRLSKEAYLQVQTIYYPGFTIGGIAEIGGIIALLILLAFTSYASTRFWWTLTAFICSWPCTRPIGS
jgi:hypothetical protein